MDASAGAKASIVKRKTLAKRRCARRHQVRRTLHRRRHLPIPVQGAWLRGVVRGYLQYHAVPGNMAALATFRRESVRHWLRALRRRSQRHRMPWSRFGKIADVWIPKPKILHAYPNDRFYAKHPRQEPSAVILHAGICAGGGPKGLSLPRPRERTLA